MPIQFIQSLSTRERSQRRDFALACCLTLVAGATNAGGFLAVKLYTSHMSGIVASMADFVVLGDGAVALSGLGALLSFMAGAATTAVLVNWARRKNLHAIFALPLALEAALLLVFGLVGGNLDKQVFTFVSLTVMLLCFLMGLQNALITKVSNARIRTTHITGMVTDIGIELGKLFYWNREKSATSRVVANHENLAMLVVLVSLFFLGGLVGALGFKAYGFLFTAPLAVGVAVISWKPIWSDFRERVGSAG
jgi:uncharacterized membrane protein YoaK (UPF0700 family)